MLAMAADVLRALTTPGRLATWAGMAIALVIWSVVRMREGRLSFSRHVATDSIYSAFYLGGIYGFFIATPFFAGTRYLIHRFAPFLELNLLATVPVIAQFLVVSLVMDFCSYWWHRAAHALPVLWAFHRIHHSQIELTPLTNFRFHFGDMLVRGVFQAIPAAMLGVPAGLFLVAVAVETALNALAHADIGWSFGPAGGFVVSPRFHRIHHSNESNVYRSNYGLTFSIWDKLFGTAHAAVARPAAYGVDETMPSGFFRQLPDPFVVLIRLLTGRRATIAEPRTSV